MYIYFLCFKTFFKKNIMNIYVIFVLVFSTIFINTLSATLSHSLKILKILLKIVTPAVFYDSASKILLVFCNKFYALM